MARPKSNHTIDYRCITIGVNGEGINGLVNNASNVRCEDNKETGDGFVYTCSTQSNGKDGYEYKYDTNQGAGNDLDKIKGNTDNRYLYANFIRGDKNSEGTINLRGIDAGKQFSGKVTDKNVFVYNEGNSTTLKDGTTGEGIDNYQGENPTTLKKYDVKNFYDPQTIAFSDQLTKVRNLNKSE